MISLVSTVRAPRGDLERFVNYHQNVGVGRIQLFFDDPNDEMLPAMRALPGVEAVACTPEHWHAAGVTPSTGIEARQIRNAELALARSREEGDSWLVHIDVDELVRIPGDDIVAWLTHRAQDIESIIFPVWEAIPATSSHRHPFEACKLFKVEPSAKSISCAKHLGCHQVFRYGYFCGHLLGKAATRVDSSIDRMGIHFPSKSSGRAVASETAVDVVVLHYDSCTFEAWREKWIRRKDGSGAAAMMRPSRRAQFEDFLAAESTGSLSQLRREYIRQRRVPAYERAILRTLGLAKIVRLAPHLFRAPAAAPPPASVRSPSGLTIGRQ